MQHAAPKCPSAKSTGLGCRVLVVNSVNDELTENRARAQSQSLRLAEYEIRHEYAVLLLPPLCSAEPQVVMEYVAAQGLDENEFYRRIENTIKTFRPTVCVVHAGFVFHEFKPLLSKLAW